MYPFELADPLPNVLNFKVLFSGRIYIWAEEVGHENDYVIILHGVAWVYTKPDDVIVFVTNLL